MGAQAVGPTSLSSVNANVENRFGLPCSFHSVHVQGTFTGLTLILEGSVDGVNWLALKLSQASDFGTVTANVISTIGIFTVTLPVPLTLIRARVTAIASGAALVTVASA